MITKQIIYRVLSSILIICSLVSIGLTLYLGNESIFLGWWLFSLFIFAATFVMELFQVNIDDSILWVAARFKGRGSRQKIEK